MKVNRAGSAREVFNLPAQISSKFVAGEGNFSGKTLGILIIFLFLAFAWTSTVQAGFGISPATIEAPNLGQGTHFEQKFVLSRGQPTEDLVANVSFEFPNTPEAVKWFSVTPATSISLPEGEQRVEMFVKIDVPKDAQYKNYVGFMRVGVGPAETGSPQGVAISLGARIEINLNVTEIKIISFTIRDLRIPASEEGFHWWKIFLPGKINFVMNVENTGNVKAAPLKATIEVYDPQWKNLIYQKEDKSLEELEPFQKKDIAAGFWHKLAPGQYWSIIKVFKDEKEILREEKIFITIEQMTMSTKDWLLLGGAVLGIIILITSAILIYFKRKEILKFFKKPRV